MNTPRFALPMLSVAQSQKELTHNEALILLDALVQPAVESRTAVVPANLGLPDAGKCWVVDHGAGGVWSGHDDHIACWSGDDWRYVAPVEGMQIYLAISGARQIYVNNQWLVAPPIGDPAGGTVVDGEARATITALLAHLRTIGIISA
jgi:Protein of unknown function (DUF2793)